MHFLKSLKNLEIPKILKSFTILKMKDKFILATQKISLKTCLKGK